MADIFTRTFRKELRSLERQVELSLLAQTECCGVTPAQCHLLLEVEGADTPSVGELAASLDLDPSTLSRTVDGLVKAGLLLRREDPSNRRRQLVGLSPAGAVKAGVINAVCDRYYEELFASLPEKDAATLRGAIPLLAGILRNWRLSGAGGTCCLNNSGGKE